MIDSPFFAEGDIVEIVNTPWNWRELRKALPHQVSEDMVDNATPISRVAKVEKIYSRHIGGNNTRVYLLRFTSDHPLEVGDEFMTRHALKIDRDLFADSGTEESDKK